jgi:hypothetical protein
MATSKTNGDHRVSVEAMRVDRDLMARLTETSRSVSAAEAPPDLGELAREFPCLFSVMFSYLSSSEHTEGASLVIWGDARGVNLLLNIRQLGIKSFHVSGTILEALRAAEDHLADPEAKWHRDKGQKGRSRKPGGRTGPRG